jgi:hypothetical protein
VKGWSTRELVMLAVFGALWGVAEMTLGAVLHALRLPFTGLTMSAIGMLIVLTGYRFVPRRGAVLTVGLVCSLLKAFSVGSIVLSPMLAILAETMLAELGLALAGGQPRRGPLALAGALGVLWSFFHPFIGQGLLAGRGMVEVYRRTLEAGSRLLHLDPKAVPIIVLTLIVLHAAAGAAAGLLACSLGRQLSRRLQAGAG